MVAAAGPSNSQTELAQARAGLYGLLARVFIAPPTLELLAGIKEPQLGSSLAAFAVTFDADFLAGDAAAQVGELACEYARLFLGPGEHIAPFESVFIQGPDELEPRLWGAATVAVARFYEEAGLSFPAGRVPDHLGLELEAMALLARSEAEQRLAGKEDEAERLLGLQQRFCQEHLLQWAPGLCRQIELETVSSFYRQMAVVARQLTSMCDGQDTIF